MTKKQLKKLDYRKKIIQTIDLETILNELVRRGIKPTVECSSGLAKAA